MGYVIKMLGALTLFGIILLVIDGKYVDAITIAIVYLVFAGIASWLGKQWAKKTEKRAFATYQERYGIIVVTDEWLKTSEFGEGNLEFEDIFPKEHNAFFETNKIGTSYAYSLKNWNVQKGVVPITHDPTFVVISDDSYAKSGKANQRPFLITTDYTEVVRFLENHK